MEIPTMLQQYKDMVIERDAAINVSKEQITEDYKAKLGGLSKKMHEELDNQVRGFK